MARDDSPASPLPDASRGGGFLASPAAYGRLLVSVVILLVATGTVFVFSASFYRWGIDGDAFHFVKRQLLWLPIAVLGGLLMYHLDYRMFARHYKWVLAVTLVLLVVVLIPAVGLRFNQSRRWLPLGPLHFQPSELAKLAMVIFIAGFYSQRPRRLMQFTRGFLPALGVLLLVLVLIVAEPDLGTGAFIFGLSALTLLLAGVRLRYLILCGVVFAPVVGVGAYLRWGMVQHRLLGFLEPEKVHQVRHSLYALGNGGLTGVGVGEGTQKLLFLPEPYSDFIFAIIGEELGFVGCAALLLLFVALLWGAVGVARNARDYFGFLLASGIGLSLTLQAATNIAVVTASAPTKGIPLPFLTFGGSGLLMTLSQVGLLLSIQRVRLEEGPLPEFTRSELGRTVRGAPSPEEADISGASAVHTRREPRVANGDLAQEGACS